MHQNNLYSMFEDPSLPDLVPEDTILNDPFGLDNLIMPSSQPDIVGIERKLDNMTIDTNTQGLRIEIERVKRQRLQASLRQVKRDLTLMNSEINGLKSELRNFHEIQDSINYQLDGEDTRTNTLAFRCMTRMNEVLSALVSCVILSPETRSEVKTLIQELTTTIQHFSVRYAATYV